MNRAVEVSDLFGGVVGYGYDAVGNRTSLGYPDGKTVDYANNAAGRLIEVIDWESQVTSYGYDPANRLETVSLPNGVVSTYSYDEAGRLLSIFHETATELLSSFEYTYDRVGNRVQVLEVLRQPGPLPEHQVFLPLLMNGAQAGSPGLGSVEATPTLPSASAEASSSTATISPTSEPTGTPTPSQAPTGTWTPSPWPTGTPTPVATPTATSTLGPSATGTTTLASVGKATPEPTATLAESAAARGLPGLAALAPARGQPASTLQGDVITRTIVYSYDPLYRLTTADYDDGTFFHYTYDAVGNRQTQETLAGTNTYLYDIANRLIEVDGVPFTWDAKGNLLDDGPSTYTYDHANRLASVVQGPNTYTFAYNGLGDRLTQSENGSPANYSLDLTPLLDQVLSGGDTSYLYGIARIGEFRPSGQLYHLADAIGSTRQLLDTSAVVASAFSYQPFGSLHTAEGNGSMLFQFAGQAQDPSGLIHLRARYMSPQIGRFITIDIWPADPRRPSTLPRFTYAENQPINRIDPSGLISQDEAENAKQIVTRLLQQYGVRLQEDWGFAPPPLPPADAYYGYSVRASCIWDEGNWRNLHELELVEQAIEIAADGFGGTGRFRTAMLGTVRISRWNPIIREIRSFAPPVPLGFIGDIVLTNFALDASSLPDEFAIHTVIHELGHVWDWRRGLSLSRGMQQELGTVRCVQRVGCFFDIEAGAEPPPGDPNDPYAGNNSLEDWADSFATFLYPDYYQSAGVLLLVPGGIRERYVRDQIAGSTP